MIWISELRRGTGAIALALALMTMPAAAQEVAPPPTPNADRLAEEIRVLAREPRSVRALLTAGEMSARLNDPAAAAGFFARAQAIDPGNPRVKAGQAMVMVRMERPGEALRLFADAVRGGLSIDDYASDRGMAYDLIGAQGHAQLDHRVAMRRNPDDETRRRFALSLGISGNSKEAMTVLDPLLKRSDRAAWRARAFIMAMNGDAAGADKIAASMMGGFGTALSPFFRQLPTLAAADKAFAVHFGELRRTPARIADANLAPALPPIRSAPPVAVAAAETPVVAQPAARAATRATSRRAPSFAERREAARAGRVSQREARELAARQEAERVAAEQREAQRQAALQAQRDREALAAQQREAERIAAEQAAREAEARRVADLQAREREAARLREAQQVAQTPPQPSPPAAEPPAAEAPVAVSQAAPAPATMPPAPAQVAAAPRGPAVGREDNVIARIIAGITIPASELGVAPMPGERPPEPTPAPVQPAAAAVPVETVRAAPVAPRPAAPPPREEPAAAKPKAAESKAVAARGKAAADAKAEATKASAAKTKAKPDPGKTDPARIWVQVAGGANVNALPRAWRDLVAKAPAEFRGRQAWTTPLRYTNRLLTGPFKTAAEAQTFVNAIGKKGLSAFAFTSEAGQKIEKLPVN